jgi:hypothetical protein
MIKVMIRPLVPVVAGTTGVRGEHDKLCGKCPKARGGDLNLTPAFPI